MSEHDDLRYHRPSSALAPVLEMYSGFMHHELLSTFARSYFDCLAPPVQPATGKNAFGPFVLRCLTPIFFWLPALHLQYVQNFEQR